MNSVLHRKPVVLTEKEHVGYDPRNYDHSLAIEKAGALEINLKKNGTEEFEILFIDKSFHFGSPATINLNVDAVFDLVQDCRDAWDQALAGLATMRPSASGGQKQFRPYESQWDKPVDAPTFNRLGGNLAIAGERLFASIFERNQGTPLDKVAEKLRAMAAADSFALAVYATDFHIPWRMLYTHPHVGESLAPDGSNFDPKGFWGYRHVIEQFTQRHDIRDYVLARDKLSFGAALDECIDKEFDVDCIQLHRKFIERSAAHLAYTEWTTKAQVMAGLAATPFAQQVLYFLCHGEGAGTINKPVLTPPSLQLTNLEEIKAADIRASVKRRFDPSPPLIFINACRGGQLNTLVRHNFTFASEFLQQGAVCVIGPQLEVPAVFAGEFGKEFFERLIIRAVPPPQVGILLRDLTCDMWDSHRNPFGLVYSLYAGADCHINWDKGPAG
jgi:hypothetical protein